MKIIDPEFDLDYIAQPDNPVIKYFYQVMICCQYFYQVMINCKYFCQTMLYCQYFCQVMINCKYFCFYASSSTRERIIFLILKVR